MRIVTMSAARKKKGMLNGVGVAFVVAFLWTIVDDSVLTAAFFQYRLPNSPISRHGSATPTDAEGRMQLPDFFFPVNKPGENHLPGPGGTRSDDDEPLDKSIQRKSVQNPEGGFPREIEYSRLPSLLDAVYIFSAVCFILCLRGLSTPETSKRGNIVGMVGMAAAIAVTFTQQGFGGHYVAFCFAVSPAVAIGLYVAHYVQMVQMPQLVALFHSFVGLAAMLVAFSSYHSPSSGDTEQLAHLIETYIGVFIAAVTFTGSLVAAAKLHEIIDSQALKLKGRHLINGGIITVIVVAACLFSLTTDWLTRTSCIYLAAVLSLFLGYHLVSSIGGADMPVVISMLNSYSGFATAASGFMLDSSLLIIAGSLIGSAGAILSYIMCRGMNRDFLNVIFGGWGDEGFEGLEELDGVVRETTVETVVDELLAANRIVIIPGYGMAVSRCQTEVAEIAKVLTSVGANVVFAIHPVAGRMPGHMNVLLAEADVPYSIVKEMDEVNPQMHKTDVALVVGANDTVNPASLNPQSKIFGMPVIQVWCAKRVIVCKRSMARGYAAIDNPLFTMDNARMLFGDAKDRTSEICGRLRQRAALMELKKVDIDIESGPAIRLSEVLSDEEYPPPLKTVGVLKDSNGGAELVALAPAFVPRLRKMGYKVVVEAGAGQIAKFTNNAYEVVGAVVMSSIRDVIMESDILLKVSVPNDALLQMLPRRKILISYLWPGRDPSILEKLAKAGVTAFAVDEVPRATRAQKLDVRSSMSNLQGYRAVIEAFSVLPRLSKTSVTAAGKVDAAKVFVIGAGVAGLQAIATAHGLGAQVFANDSRTATKEEVESCGGKFLAVPIIEEGQASTGYAVEMSEAYKKAQEQLYRETLKNVDVVICTAAIPGKPSPKLITESMVTQMRAGSVIVDLATEFGDRENGWGGNCQLSPLDGVADVGGVTVIGRSRIESHMPTQASELFSMNITNLLEELGGGTGFAVNLEDEIIKSMCVVLDGRVLWTPPAPVVAAKPLALRSVPESAPSSYRRSKRTLLEQIETSDLFFALCLFAVAVTVGVIGTVLDTLELHHLFLFILSLIVGYYCVWSVTPALHTPLMSVTNALSGVIIIGSMVEYDGSLVHAYVICSLAATFLASLNISAGFYVTKRMLDMFTA